ncbi:UNVERIFIED_CONTAM: hypothetical protein FKN15_010521 [Acipenser sinensis]
MKLFLVLAVFLSVCWAQYNPNTQPGRTSIVHLFEWRWADIAAECERYLAPNGFGGVQISPPSESVVLSNPYRPWWERYQPISYNLCSRSGTASELKDMVTRCNNVGVRIYVDAVINHMSGATAGSGTHSSCGTFFNAEARSFPSVPYSAVDFNDGKCRSYSGDIESYNDIYQVRDCRLVSLLDLALEKEYVRGKAADYLNSLIDIGVAGFRVDACKHMWPGDLNAVYSRIKPLNTKWFPSGSKAFIYQEVIDLGGEAIKASEYFGLGRVTEFKYSVKIGIVFRKWNGEKLAYLRVQEKQRSSKPKQLDVIDLGEEAIKASEYFGLGRVTEFKYSAKIGIVFRKWNGEKLAYLRNWGEGWAFMPSDRALVFVDNHDNQRGHGPGGDSVLTFWDSRNLDVTLQTGLPAGLYCDVISGQEDGGRCTGRQISIEGDGRARFQISNTAEDPFIAIHVNAKL